MADLSFMKFNPQTVAPQNSFDPVPAGDYIAQITESSIKPTKSGSGTVLNLTWTIIDGQFTNRKIFDRVNIQNQNPEAERIGQSQLSSICHAVGVTNLQDSNQLHGRPVKVKVKIRKDEQYGDSNEIKGYSASGPVAAAPAAPFAQPAVAAPAAATPPWVKTAA